MTNTKSNKTTKNKQDPKQDNNETPKYTPDPKFKRFYLKRNVDISGISGVGIVAAGCQFEDGTVIIKWLTTTSSISIFHSLVEMEHVHGHNNSTVVIFVD